MEKKQVVERFCALSTLVRQKHFKDMVPADCFCGDNPISGTDWMGGFQFGEQVVQFIEQAVREKLESKRRFVVVEERISYVFDDPHSPMFSSEVVGVYREEKDADAEVERLETIHEGETVYFNVHEVEVE